jgi:hypothetical protein
MINASAYFAADRYIRTRLFLLILCGVPISIAAILGAAHWHIPLALVVVAIVVCIVFASVIIVRNARERAKASAGVSPARPDDAMRKKLRGRIRRLQFGVAFLALVFVYALWETRDGPLLPRVVGASINLLFQFTLIQAIRRLQKMLN